MNTAKQDIETLVGHYNALRAVEENFTQVVTGDSLYVDWTLFTPSWLLFDSHVYTLSVIHNISEEAISRFIFENDCGKNGLLDVHNVDDFLDSLG